jgi:hypothetical protein
MSIVNGASRVPPSVRSGMEVKRSNAQLRIGPIVLWAPFGHAAPDGAWLTLVGPVYYRHGAPSGACASYSISCYVTATYKISFQKV